MGPSRITNITNEELKTWMKSISEEKQVEVFYRIGEELEYLGKSSKNICDTYIQLATKTEVHLMTISEEDIISLAGIASGRSSPASVADDSVGDESAEDEALIGAVPGHINEISKPCTTAANSYLVNGNEKTIDKVILGETPIVLETENDKTVTKPFDRLLEEKRNENNGGSKNCNETMDYEKEKKKNISADQKLDGKGVLDKNDTRGEISNESIETEKGKSHNTLCDQVLQGKELSKNLNENTRILETHSSIAVTDDASKQTINTLTENLENYSSPINDCSNKVITFEKHGLKEKQCDVKKSQDSNADQLMYKTADNNLQISEELANESCIGESVQYDESLKKTLKTKKHIINSSLKKASTESKDNSCEIVSPNSLEKRGRPTSDAEIKLTKDKTDKSSDLLQIKLLKDKLAQSLSKKNITNITSTGNTSCHNKETGNKYSGGIDTNVNKDCENKTNKKKPLISVRTNLFKNSTEQENKESKETNGNKFQNKEASKFEGEIRVKNNEILLSERCIKGTENNIYTNPTKFVQNMEIECDEPEVDVDRVGKNNYRASRTSNERKPKEEEKNSGKDLKKKIKPHQQSKKPIKIDDIVKFNSLLVKTKNFILSKKRGLKEGDEKNKNVKKRRTSEQSIGAQRTIEALTEREKSDCFPVVSQNKPDNNDSHNRVSDKPEITLKSLLTDGSDNRQYQPLMRPGVAVRESNESLGYPSDSQAGITNSSKSSLASAKFQQKINTSKSLDKTINNLHLRRQSQDSSLATGENQPASEPTSTVEAVNYVAARQKAVAVNSVKSIGNIAPNNIYDPVLAPNKDLSAVPHSDKNNLSSYQIQVPGNNQNVVNQQTASLSVMEQNQFMPSQNQPAMRPEIGRYVENAVNLFRYFNCRESDVTLECIPPQVSQSLSPYLTTREGYVTHSKKSTDILKWYLLCCIRLFNNEGVSKNINKMAELLHLSIADYHRREQRKSRAIRLTSEPLRQEEITRAEGDYKDMLILRGGKFGESFLSIISPVISGQYAMMVTLYFRITQALINIDQDNKKYIYTVRTLMFSLLRSINQPVPANCNIFFDLSTEEFKNTYMFVKQCLISLYCSGFCETETDYIMKFARGEPISPGLDRMIQWYIDTRENQRRTGNVSRAAMSTEISNAQTTVHHRPSLEMLLQTGTQHHSIVRGNDVQSEATVAITPVPSQLASNQYSCRAPNVNVQTQLRQPNVQRVVQTSTSMWPSHQDGSPTQLPSFSSLNQTQTMPQQMRNLASATSDVQTLYEHLSERQIQGTGAGKTAFVESGPPQPLMYRQNISPAQGGYQRNPPTYFEAMEQQRGLGPESQLWQPSGGTNNTPPINNLPSLNNQFVRGNQTGTARQNLIKIGQKPARQNLIRIAPAPIDDQIAHHVTRVCSAPACSQLATLVCSLCRESVYCNRDCQSQDWYQNHSKVCLK